MPDPDVAEVVAAVAALLFCDTLLNTAGAVASGAVQFCLIFSVEADHGGALTKAAAPRADCAVLFFFLPAYRFFLDLDDVLFGRSR